MYKSSGNSSSSQSSGTPPHDLSDDDDEDDLDEDSEDVTHLHRLVTYNAEYGDEIRAENDGTFFVRSEDEDSFYTFNFHRYWKYHVGILDDKRRLYRDLNASELAILRSERIDILDENYRRKVWQASGENTEQLVDKKLKETGGRRKRRRRKDRKTG